MRQGTLSGSKVILVKEFLFYMLNSSMSTEQNDFENDRDHVDPVHSALWHLNSFT